MKTIFCFRDANCSSTNFLSTKIVTYSCGRPTTIIVLLVVCSIKKVLIIIIIQSIINIQYKIFLTLVTMQETPKPLFIGYFDRSDPRLFMHGRVPHDGENLRRETRPKRDSIPNWTVTFLPNLRTMTWSAEGIPLPLVIIFP